jgi:DNA helicase HerA-like ATPase
MQEYGTVISTVDSPCTRKFSFVVKKEAGVRKGQFVQLDMADGKLIARVSDVFKTNRYFMRPDSVKEYESSGAAMSEIFPTDNWEYLVAEVVPLGVFSNNAFHEVSVPPSPGMRVKEPDLSILAKFFGFDEKGIEVGSVPYHDIKVSLNMTKLLHKHLAILAISGAGKSYLTSVLIEELLNNKKPVSVVVIDTHGEYTSFAEDPDYAGKVTVLKPKDIKIGLPNLSVNQLAEFIPKLSFAQARELSRIMKSLKGEYTIEGLIESVEKDKQAKPTTKDVLVSVLTELEDLEIFDIMDKPGLTEIAKQGRMCIIDVSEVVNVRKKQIVVAHIAEKLFNARRAETVPPFLLIVEEAHQFAPETAKRERAISRGIIQTIAREGRKFHACLCLISQRPIQLSTTALSQCNTQIILRVTNPYDLDHIGKSSEGITKDVLGQISGLRIGSGLIVGEAVNFPVFVQIRKRKSKEPRVGMSLEQAIADYEDRSKKKLEDSKAFM